MHFYDDWAQRILNGQFTDHLAFYGLPLYPYLLALIYKLTGYGPFLPVLIQAALEGGTAVIIYRLGVLTFSPKDPPKEAAPTLVQVVQRNRGAIVGGTAALGWAFFMPAQAYAVIVMPTIWFVFMFWLLLWLVLRGKEAPGWAGSLFYGVAIGFTAMGVATILFLVPLVVAAILLKTPRSRLRQRWMGQLAAILLLLGGIGLGASPCWIHNYFIAKDPVFLSAHSGVNFWIGNNPFATGYPRFPPGLHAGQEVMLNDSINVAEKAAGRPLKRSEVSAYWSAKAKDYIRNHFGDWLRLLATKIGNFWNAFQYDDLSMITALREHRVILPGFGFGLIAALALPGLVIAVVPFPMARWIAGAIALHMTSLLSVFVTERYRLAVVPGLFLLGAAGVMYFWEAGMLKKYGQAGLYLLLLVLATLFVSSPKRDPSLWALDSYNSGWQALESNDFVTAERKLNVAYAYVPENAETNFALGNLHLMRNERDAAKSFYRATLNLDASHEGAYNNLGILALQEERWELAAKFFSKALQQDPREAKTYYLLGQAYFNARDLDKASVALMQALKLRPAQAEFLALREKIEHAKSETAP